MSHKHRKMRENDTYSTDHAWGCPADLEVVLANFSAVEHRVEAGNFVDLHRGHIEDLCSFVHGGQGQKVVVLLLSDEEHRNDCRRLVIVGVPGQELLDGSVRLLSKFEWSLIQVVFSVSMVRKSTKVVALCRT